MAAASQWEVVGSEDAKKPAATASPDDYEVVGSEPAPPAKPSFMDRLLKPRGTGAYGQWGTGPKATIPSAPGLPGGVELPKEELKQAAGEVTGYPQLGRGVKKLVTSGAFSGRGGPAGTPASHLPTEAARRQALAGASDVLSGIGRAIAPIGVGAFATAPAMVAAGYGVGTGASELAGRGLHGKVSPETEDFARNVAFWVPGLASEALGLRGGVASSEEGTVGGATVLGGKAGVTGAVTPEEIRIRAGFGSRRGELVIPRGGRPAGSALEPPTIEGTAASAPDVTTQALTNQALLEGAATRVVNGQSAAPPTPPPPPTYVPPDVQAGHISPETVSGIAEVLAKLPPNLRAHGILEAHATLSRVLQQQGKMVGPGGQVHVIDSPKTADKLAGDWINEEVSRQDKLAAKASTKAKAGEGAASATASGVAAPESKPGRSRTKAAELAKAQQYEIVGSEPAPVVESAHEIESANSGLPQPEGMGGSVRGKPVHRDAADGVGGENRPSAGDSHPEKSVAGENERDLPNEGTNRAGQTANATSERKPFQKGDQVVLADGRKGTIEFIHPSMNIVRGHTEEGKKFSSGTSKLQRVTVENSPAPAENSKVVAEKSAVSPKDAAVIYARHGATKFDKEGGQETVAGWSDESLDERGREAADKMAKELKGSGVTTIVSSDLPRAKETADIVGKEIGVPVTTDERLRPQHVPEIEGKEVSQIQHVRDDLKANPDKVPQGGESYNGAKERQDAAIADVNKTAKDGGKPLVITHSTNLASALGNSPEPGGIVPTQLDTGKAEQPAPIASAKPEHPERRTNVAERKRVTEMSHEEMKKELLTSPVTQMPNRRAFEEAGPSKAVGMSDADGLKAFNDKFGYEAGNELLRAKADSLKEAGLDAYHEKGDEFLYRGDSEPELQSKLTKARSILKSKEFKVTDADGRTVTLKGVDFSHGTGPDLAAAEKGLKAHKSEREAKGERARGELRGITEVGHEAAAQGGKTEVGPPTSPQNAPGPTISPEKAPEPTAAQETSAQPLGAKESSPTVEPGKVGEMRVSDLKLAPHKFQYKLATDAEGVSPLLKEVKVFNPDLAQTISVWRDPADDKTYVVNGHHRFELAKRTGTKKIAVRHLKAENAQEARAIGARQNIAEGRGTPVDAAKFFRDTTISPEDLEKYGISLGEATARDGMALSKLDASIFSKVIAGDLRQGRAVAIGESTSDPAEQKAILNLLERKERFGSKISDDTLKELIRFTKGAAQTTETTADLFGSQEIKRSLAIEKAEISAHIKQQLAKDKKLFGFVSKEGRATELARAGNKINVEESKAISTGAAQAEEVYNKLSERGGPIASILDEAAKRLADGKESPAAIKSDAYQRVRTEVSKTLGGEEEPVPQGLEKGAGRAGAVEPTLPGMEHVPAERAEANAEHQGQELTAQLTAPPKSIEGKAGEIEQRSPLFRDTEANPQRDMFGNLFKGESGQFEPGKAGEAAAKASGAVGNYIRHEVFSNKVARDLHAGLYDLESQYSADVLRAVHTMQDIQKDLGDKSKPVFADIYHHLENPEGQELTPAEDKVLDDTLIPIMQDTNEKFAQLEELLGKQEANLIENYVHRVVKGKGSFFDRIIKGIKGTGRGNLLTKTSPQTKHRVMMALENAKGERVVVSIKGGQVTAWDQGRPQNLGGISHTDEGKAWTDSAGKEWRLTQATTREIEGATDIRYYHNALASALISNLQIRKALRGAEAVNAFKQSPEFKDIAMKVGTGTPPNGWRISQLPQMRDYYFEPHTAEVLDWYAKRIKGQDPNIFDKLNSFLRTSIFFNPLIHTPNIAVHWAVEKGPSGYIPTTGGTRTYRTSVKAINAVIHQNQDFLDALDAGAPLQSQREDTQQLTKLFFDQLSDGLEKNEDWATKLAKTVGMAPVDLVKAIYKFSGKATWVTNDVAFLQSAYEKVEQGMDLKTALRETGKHIPDYRLPTRMLNSAGLAKILSNNAVTMFMAYHYGALKSYGEMAKSALGASEPPPGSGRTKAQEVAHGWELLAGLGLLTFVLYPLIADKVAQQVTGDKKARFRRAGAATFPYNMYMLATHQKSASEVMQAVATPAVGTKTAAELAVNRDFFTGRHIYDPLATWQDEAHEIGRKLAESVSPVGQGVRAYEDEGHRKRMLFGMAGISFPGSRAERIAQQIASANAPTAAWTEQARKSYYARQRALDALRKGDEKPLLAYEDHEISQEQAHTLRRRAKLTPLQDKVHGFTYSEVVRVYEAAKADNDQDAMKQLEPVLRQKKHNLLRLGRGREAEAVAQ